MKITKITHSTLRRGTGELIIYVTVFTDDGKKTFVELEYNASHMPGQGYWMGYVIYKQNINQISFGYSNYRNTAKYILKAIKYFIETNDWTYVMPNGHYAVNPSGPNVDAIRNKNEYLRPDLSKIFSELPLAERLAWKKYPNNEHERTAFMRGWQECMNNVIK